MNIDHIKTFIAVYRAGSFVEVAKGRNVAPSSISRAIAALEINLKTRLFQRTTRHLIPTQEGQTYYERIVPLIEEMDLAHESLMNTTAEPSGCLRITASVSYGQIMIAPRLKVFRARYPNIELELILSDGQIDLISDQIDIAVRHGNLPDSSLVARKLADVTYRLVSSKAYLEQNGTPQIPQDLQKHALVTFAYENFRYAWKFEANGVSQRIPIKPILTSTNAVAIKQCIHDDTGIALLADWTIKDDLKSGALVELLEGWQICGDCAETGIWLMYPSSRFIPAKTRAFIEFLLDPAN